MLHAFRVPSYRKRRLEPWAQRGRRLERWLRGGFAKRQRVYRVTIGGHTLKKIVFPHASQAEAVAERLEALRETGVLPQPVARYANELWTEFIEGRALPRGAAPIEELAELFAVFYALGSRPLVDGAAKLRQQTQRHLRFLREVRVVDEATLAALRERLASETPGLRLGYDYLDARPGNFLWTHDGRLQIIDIESVVDDELIGTGAARAWLRWPGIGRGALLSAIEARGGPALAPVAGFLEIRFAAAWTMRSVLQRKPKLVDPALFRRLAAEH